jgi:hypothetical protein
VAIAFRTPPEVAAFSTQLLLLGLRARGAAAHTRAGARPRALPRHLVRDREQPRPLPARLRRHHRHLCRRASLLACPSPAPAGPGAR